MSTNSHMDELLKKKNEWTITYLEGDKVKSIDSCKILALDTMGLTFEEMKKIGRNRVYFVPMLKLVKLRNELI